MPSLQPADESFLTSAPQRFSRTFEIERPADLVWSELTGDQPLYWVTGLGICWTSAPPFGVNSTRQASVFGPLLHIQEHFFRWEDTPGQTLRHSFYGAAMNLPLFRRLAEDYVVEPRGEDRCAFTWTIAIEPSLIGRPGAPVNALVFAQAFRDTARHYRVA